MIESAFLQILIIFGFTIVVSYISALLRFPIIIAFILSGVLIGPGGLGLVSHGGMVEAMAEIGLAMLLFTVGIEFDQEKIRNVRRYFFLGGGLQVGFTVVFLATIFYVLGASLNQALFYSFMLTMSSSALVFRILSEKRIVRSVRGNLISGILLFQDLAFVPMLISIPFLLKKGSATSFLSLAKMFYGFLFLAMVLILKYFGERLFRYLVKLNCRELNLLLAVFIPFAFSIISYKLGFSFALGAFIAGVLLAESDFHLQIISDIMPFKEIFNAFFFIAAGMLFELSSFLENWRNTALLILLLMLVKGGLVFLVAKLFRFSTKHSLYVGFFLFQSSEFTFVLAQTGWRFGLIDRDQFNLFFSATILTLLLTPLLIEMAEKFIFGKETGESEVQGKIDLRKHTVIAGYGLTGKNLALALKRVRIPFVVVDLNYQTIRRLKKEEFPVLFGDIASEEVLERANIAAATILVMAISDPRAAKVAISKARQKNPALQIIARTRYLSEIENIFRIGANEVIGEEFETSIEIFSRALRHYHIPGNVVETIIKTIRTQNYAILRGRSSVDMRWEKLNALIEAGTVETFLIDEQMYACGKSILDLDLRKRTETTIVAVVRGGKSHPSPKADFVIAGNDILVLTAAHQNLEQAFLFLEKGKT